MNVELVAQMFKNYQSNVLFHLEGERLLFERVDFMQELTITASYRQPERSIMSLSFFEATHFIDERQ